MSLSGGEERFEACCWIRRMSRVAEFGRVVGSGRCFSGAGSGGS